MAQKLLSGKHLKNLHIALFFLVASLGIKATAQSVLLPGDVVIVSANADTNSIDFIPLIDIEKGTELYFSNGSWDRTAQTLSGSELKITFNTSIQAGTNIHLNGLLDKRFDVKGKIHFEGLTHRLFAYQKEEVYRFIFALGWGKGLIWNTSEDQNIGSDIPESLEGNQYSLLTLGEASNYQYYIRNGASGTRNLLLQYVGNPSHWRGKDAAPYPVFGTSFNLLTPPVVLFDQSVSTVQESDSMAVLNVAIYEHDGSRLSVDVKFDTLRSITSPNDYTEFETTTLNFTGLIGDGVYEVKVPVNDDEVYEGRETGIFTLQNLSKGNFGDFITHSLIITENEKPEVLISQVIHAPDGTGYVEIQNMEAGVVSLSGWSLVTKDQKYTFEEGVVLYPEQSIRVKDTSLKWGEDASETVIYTGLEKPLLQRRGGELLLKDFNGEVLHKFEYTAIKRTGDLASEREELVAENKVIAGENQGRDINDLHSQASILQSIQPGFTAISNTAGLAEAFPKTILYGWDESKQRFHEVSSEAYSDYETLIGFFEVHEEEKLAEWKNLSSQKSKSMNTLTFTVSATDQDENDILNGIEGLNLVYNKLNVPIKVSHLITLTEKKYPGITLNPNIYYFRRNASGELDFKVLEKDEQIPPQAPFWILLDNFQPKTELTFELQEIAQLANPVDVEETDDEASFIKLLLSTQNQQEDVAVHFVKEGITESTKNLNSYPALFLGKKQALLNLAFRGGDEYFSEMTLSSGIEQTLSLPLQFSSSHSGKMTLSVSDWEAIPADWEIKLEDKVTEKEYILREDFNLIFDHSVIPAEEKADEEITLDDYTEKDRFVVHIQPPGQSIEGDEGGDTLPQEVELHQNFPNPFNPATTISFYLPEPEEVRLSIFNIVGQPIAVIAEGAMSAGEHQFEWDATDKPSGMYIYQLEVGKSVMTRKMTLVK